MTDPRLLTDIPDDSEFWDGGPWTARQARYLPVSEHGMIGDLHTVALVGTNGTIDWHCSPPFDAPSIFGSLVDADKGGSFELGAAVRCTTRQQQGNFPQALTHLALISATFNLDRSLG